MDLGYDFFFSSKRTVLIMEEQGLMFLSRKISRYLMKVSFCTLLYFSGVSIPELIIIGSFDRFRGIDFQVRGMDIEITVALLDKIILIKLIEDNNCFSLWLQAVLL